MCSGMIAHHLPQEARAGSSCSARRAPAAVAARTPSAPARPVTRPQRCPQLAASSHEGGSGQLSQEEAVLRAQPWRFAAQTNERLLAWDESAQTALLKIWLADKLAVDVAEVCGVLSKQQQQKEPGQGTALLMLSSIALTVACPPSLTAAVCVHRWSSNCSSSATCCLTWSPRWGEREQTCCTSCCATRQRRRSG
jgi:hypothetical protein